MLLDTQKEIVSLYMIKFKITQSKSLMRERERVEDARLIAKIDAHAHEGKLYVEESGRDCDCVQYSGHIHCIDATLDAYNALGNDIGEWADGPFYLRIVTKEQADETNPLSRDLALEAYENGHPYSIHV